MEPWSEDDLGSGHVSNCADDEDIEIEDGEEAIAVPSAVVEAEEFSGKPKPTKGKGNGEWRKKQEKKKGGSV